jgi:hypothetical protein
LSVTDKAEIEPTKIAPRPKRRIRRLLPWIVAALALAIASPAAANAAIVPLGGDVQVGYYKYYYGIFRPHTSGPASFRLDSVTNLCGGAERFGLYDGTGPETGQNLFTGTGYYQSFTWGGGYTLPTQTYAVYAGNTGACGSTLTSVWTGTLQW